jgi:phosphotransferase system HPr (HPr) family protein
VISRDVVFHDRYGLHPRAARRIQASLDGISASVSLEKLDGGSSPIDARGMLGLISSGIRTGDRVRVTADGADEVNALAAVGDLIDSGVCHPDARP